MKLSTRIKKTLPVARDCAGNERIMDFYGHEFIIVLMVDCSRKEYAVLLRDADKKHEDLLASGCTLLTKESPVVNSGREVIFHYTTTTYKEWCKA